MYVEDSELSSSKCEYIFSKVEKKIGLAPTSKALSCSLGLGT